MCFKPVYLNTQRFAVPCGKCFECRQEYARRWTFRLIGECRASSSCCMVTLTYNDEHLPKDMCVSRRECQLFLKRLRKAIAPTRIRYFYCGEYGAKRLRPHYHLLLFGYSFPDRYYFGKDKKGTPLFRSPLLEKVWTSGFSSIVPEITSEVCKYVALYMQKPPVDGRARPFVGMSNRPGIGYSQIKPGLLLSDKLYVDGHYMKLPRYYLNVLERQGYDLTELKEKRKATARREYINRTLDREAVFRLRRQKIGKIEKIFGRPLDRNLMV